MEIKGPLISKEEINDIETKLKYIGRSETYFFIVKVKKQKKTNTDSIREHLIPTPKLHNMCFFHHIPDVSVKSLLVFIVKVNKHTKSQFR